MDTKQKARVKESQLELVERLASELNLPRAAIADVAYLYLQKHPLWGRNPSKAQKRVAHKHWDGKCQNCLRPVTFIEAVFHHRKRRIDDQHLPQNLLPYHEKCHDEHHGLVSGSLSKGSPKRRPRS